MSMRTPTTNVLPSLSKGCHARERGNLPQTWHPRHPRPQSPKASPDNCCLKTSLSSKVVLTTEGAMHFISSLDFLDHWHQSHQLEASSDWYPHFLLYSYCVVFLL